MLNGKIRFVCTFIAAYLFVSSLCFSQTSTKGPASSFGLQGTLSGRDTGKIVLWYPDTTGTWIRDIAAIEKGSFSFSGYLVEPSFVHLIGSEKEGNYASFFLETGYQTVSLKENAFTDLNMTGSNTQLEYDKLLNKIKAVETLYYTVNVAYEQLNKEYNSQKDIVQKKEIGARAEGLRIELAKKDSCIRKEKILFITSHPDSYVSPTLLYPLLPYLANDSASTLFKSLTPRIINSRTGVLCETALYERNRLTAGNVAASFTEKDINGKEVSLAQFKGSYVLLDFWASWCIPCRKEIPYLKSVFKRYHNKGLEIVSISVDKNHRDWEEAVRNEGLGIWYNILANVTFKRGYQNLDFLLPTQLLIDPNGIIVWNSNEGKNETLEQIFTKQLK